MRQFEVRWQRAGRNEGEPIAILQHDLAEPLETRVVAPVLPVGRLSVVPRLHPVVTMTGQDRLFMTDRQSIGELTGSIADVRDDVSLALDLLFKGF